MTIEWRYTAEQGLGILSLTGYLGPDAVHRFEGAIGWVVGRGTGPVVVDLTGLRGWSTEGQLAITDAARRLAEAGRSLELAAIPTDGSLVPDGNCPPIPVHADLAGALAAHKARHDEAPEGHREQQTTEWPSRGDTGQ
ncbi:STAS domain-containing protein [Streptomyces sp. GQFP]|uniref:STAS domain-containing protein n=1 Tax=Streptomyces sp. GQFP TaxID=2907545 RepID=UPI001F1BFE55|nr:STAS domain-containing protein [Streptomyces sp. GQFP]UIX34247.1 STAS domain-containing protein [Streptomyces sp. GQFP]